MHVPQHEDHQTVTRAPAYGQTEQTLRDSYGPEWRERATRPRPHPDIAKRGAALARRLLAQRKENHQ